MRPMTPAEDRRDTLEALAVVMSVSLLPFLAASLGLGLIHLGVIRVPDLDLSVPSAQGLGSGLKTVVNFGMGGFAAALMVGLWTLQSRIRRNRLREAEDRAAGV